MNSIDIVVVVAAVAAITTLHRHANLYIHFGCCRNTQCRYHSIAIGCNTHRIWIE